MAEAMNPIRKMLSSDAWVVAAADLLLVGSAIGALVRHANPTTMLTAIGITLGLWFVVKFVVRLAWLGNPDQVRLRWGGPWRAQVESIARAWPGYVVGIIGVTVRQQTGSWLAALGAMMIAATAFLNVIFLASRHRAHTADPAR
ncbi:MAG: hypothetical protein ACYCYA_06000 [Actinomycetes bacterium]